MNYHMTPDEDDIIARCHAWLDDETIEICQGVATSVADDITGREDAEVALMNTLVEIIIRNRRSAGRGA